MSVLSRLASTACALVALTGLARADALTDAVIDQHILPTYERLATETAEFATLTENDCAPTSEAVRTAWGEAFDAWVAASHLRFGPSESDNRAFAIAFWPDSRSKTPKALRSLLLDSDPVVNTPEDFATASVAVRGFYALEYLFYDPAYADLTSPDYACAFVKAVAQDVSRNSAAILTDWQEDYADKLRHPDDRYRSDEEAHQELFKALTTGWRSSPICALAARLAHLTTRAPIAPRPAALAALCAMCRSSWIACANWLNSCPNAIRTSRNI